MKNPNEKNSSLHYLEYSYWNDINNIQTMSIMHAETVPESEFVWPFKICCLYYQKNNS